MVPARWAAAGAAMACLALAAPARAQTTIDSADMEIDVGTAGELDGSFNSDGFGQVLTYGLAGLQIDLNDTTAIGIGQFTPVGQGAVGGSGTAADPYTVTTQFDATAGGATVLHVTEVVTHVNGDPRIPVELKLQNASGTAQKVRAVEWGEVAGGGFAQGTGTLLAGPPRYVAGVFPTTGSVSGLEQVTQWDHYQEADDATLSTQLSNASASLNDTVAATGGPHDPAVGAEWDRTLANGDTATLDVAWRFVPGAAHLDLAPGDGSGPPDQPACFTATVTTIYGAPLAGIPVDFDAGDPHPPLTAATNAAGQAAYCVTAAEPDEELFVDAEVADALLDGFSTWTFNGGASDTTGGGGTPPAPVAGSRVTARVVSGRVRLRHGTRYTTITGAQSIKVGSMLDARHGTVELTAAVHGRTQTGRFGAGIFRVRQATASAPVALFLAGPAFGPSCQAGSHKVVRRLRAVTAGGRWQTVARASTAGVTKAASWITRDRCDGTLTVVHKGAATVRDAHGHAFAVRAGRRRLVLRRSVRSG